MRGKSLTFTGIFLNLLVLILIICAIVFYTKSFSNLNSKYEYSKTANLELVLKTRDSNIKYYYGGFNFALASQIHPGVLVYSFNKPLRAWDISIEPVFDCPKNRKELSLASRILSIKDVAYVQLAEFGILIIPGETNNINLIEEKASRIILLYFRERQI